MAQMTVCYRLAMIGLFLLHFDLHNISQNATLARSHNPRPLSDDKSNATSFPPCAHALLIQPQPQQQFDDGARRQSAIASHDQETTPHFRKCLTNLSNSNDILSRESAHSLRGDLSTAHDLISKDALCDVRDSTLIAPSAISMNPPSAPSAMPFLTSALPKQQQQKEQFDEPLYVEDDDSAQTTHDQDPTSHFRKQHINHFHSNDILPHEAAHSPCDHLSTTDDLILEEDVHFDVGVSTLIALSAITMNLPWSPSAMRFLANAAFLVTNTRAATIMY